MRKKREQVRIIYIGKQWWTALACLCLAAVMFYVVNYPAAVGASAATRQLPIYCVHPAQGGQKAPEVRNYFKTHIRTSGSGKNTIYSKIRPDSELDHG